MKSHRVRLGPRWITACMDRLRYGVPAAEAAGRRVVLITGVEYRRPEEDQADAGGESLIRSGGRSSSFSAVLGTVPR